MRTLRRTQMFDFSCACEFSQNMGMRGFWYLLFQLQPNWCMFEANEISWHTFRYEERRVELRCWVVDFSIEFWELSKEWQSVLCQWWWNGMEFGWLRHTLNLLRISLKYGIIAFQYFTDENKDTKYKIEIICVTERLLSCDSEYGYKLTLQWYADIVRWNLWLKLCAIVVTLITYVTTSSSTLYSKRILFPFSSMWEGLETQKNGKHKYL